MGEKRVPKWYFGGLAAAGAACFTHPLDLIKVHLQTQQEVKLTLVQSVTNIVKTNGALSLYNGISASLLRQGTYSSIRFSFYELAKQYISKTKQKVTFLKAVLVAGMSGAAGGFVGTPADVINVRMQNDMKLPPDKRRNYKNVIDGFIRVSREEGPMALFSGATVATSRAVLMTVGQLSFYDLFKANLMKTGYFQDNIITHFSASTFAGAVATTITQPLDVVKTRLMNAKPGDFKGIWDVILYTAKLGPLGFFKGYLPAFVRLGPQTILTFVFYEQLIKNFGTIKKFEEDPKTKGKGKKEKKKES